MKIRSSSLRLRVLAVMVLPAALLMLVAFLVFDRVSSASAENASYHSDFETAAAVAQAASDGPSVAEIAAFQKINGDDQITVVYHGRVVFRGRRNDGPAPFVITRPFPGGVVTVVGDVNATTVLSLQLTAIAAGLLLVLAVVALAGTTTLIRGIREPLERAASVADRLAGGDLAARMGSTGPDQFRRLARAFDSMASRLQAADRDQEQFLSDLAHEIATPVTAVIGLAGAALDHTIATPQQEQEAITLLDGETVRLRGLLDDLRHLRMLELPAPLEWRSVDLAAMCDDLVRQMGVPARSAGLDLRLRVSPLEVVTDARLVERILTNFLTNAIRYTPSGGSVELAITSNDTDEVVVSVTDTGIGIPVDEQDRVFDRFHRVAAARDRVSGGTGLGLAIARRAAVTLGGRIELESSAGQGSTFKLVVPARPDARIAGSDPERATGDELTDAVSPHNRPVIPTS
jgi:signal transduction histidine kinase